MGLVDQHVGHVVADVGALDAAGIDLGAGPYTIESRVEQAQIVGEILLSLAGRGIDGRAIGLVQRFVDMFAGCGTSLRQIILPQVKVVELICDKTSRDGGQAGRCGLTLLFFGFERIVAYRRSRGDQAGSVSVARLARSLRQEIRNGAICSYLVTCRRCVSLPGRFTFACPSKFCSKILSTRACSA